MDNKLYVMRIIFTVILSIPLVGIFYGQEINSFVTSDGETLHYTSIGKGPKVVLIPGGPGAGVASLQPWADSLSNEFNCILFDQRGTGLSSEVKLDSTVINLRRATDDLEDLRKSLGQEKLILCGISWGSMLSLAYAANFPDKAQKLVLVSPRGPDLSLNTVIFNDILYMRRYPIEKDSLEYWNNQPDNEISIQKRAFFYNAPYFFDHEIGYKYLKMFGSDFNPEMAALMRKDIQANYNLNEKLKSYKNHCIVIRGRQDIFPAEIIFKLTEILPQTRINNIERCGHFPHFEQPDEFYALLRAALRE